MGSTKNISFLCVLLIFFLTACGGSGEKTTPLFQTAPAYQTEDIALPANKGLLLGSCTDGETIYFLLASEKNDNGEDITLCKVNLTNHQTVCLSDYHPESAEMPGGDTAVTTPGNLALAPDGSLWVWETQTLLSQDTPSSEADCVVQQETVYRLRRLDPESGRAAEMIDISRAVEEIGALYINSWAVDGERNILLASPAGLTVLDKTGESRVTLEASLPAGRTGGALVLLSNGTAAVLTAPAAGKREVRTIDPAAKDWGQRRYRLPDGTDLLYSGSGDFLFYYLLDGTLWGWGREADEAQRLLCWSSAELEANSVMCFAPLAEGRMAALFCQYGSGSPYSGELSLLRLIPTDQRSDGRTVLVYGTIHPIPSTIYQINVFNKTSETHYIALRDYGEGLDWSGDAAAASEETALRRANIELAAGQIPDILDSRLPLHILAAKGFLEDLWPYIDSDPELGRAALMSHVLDCASVDGKLYLAPNGFQINTAAACASVVGDRECWTIDEVLSLWELMPEGSTIADAGLSREWLQMILIDTSRYVDWGTGECSFDSEEFKSLLELCRRFGTGEDISSCNIGGGTALREGRQVFAMATLKGPDDLALYEAMCGGPEALWDYEGLLREYDLKSSDTARAAQIKRDGGARLPDGTLLYELADGAVFGALKGSGYAAYVGYPRSGGVGSTFQLSGELAMSTACQDKEGAWSFIRRQLLPEGNLRRETDVDGSVFVSSVSFPINRSDFEAVMGRESEWFLDEDGQPLLDPNGQRIEKSTSIVPLGDPADIVLYFLAPTQDQYGRFMKLYNRIKQIEFYDNTVGAILVDSTDAYFQGDKSLEDTVNLIQSRVSLYVNEHR